MYPFDKLHLLVEVLDRDLLALVDDLDPIEDHVDVADVVVGRGRLGHCEQIVELDERVLDEPRVGLPSPEKERDCCSACVGRPVIVRDDDSLLNWD